MDIVFPGETKARQKFFVLLHTSKTRQVSFVIAGTDRREGAPLMPYQVSVGVQHNFSRDTIIDCRFVFTDLREKIQSNAKLITTLPESVMGDVNVALFAGLQMS